MPCRVRRLGGPFVFKEVHIQGDVPRSEVDAAVAYLLGALGDGGCYYLRYRGGRTEYRCVWTQKDCEWLLNSVIPRLNVVAEYFGVKSKIRLIEGKTRCEVRVSSKVLYTVLIGYMKNLADLVLSDEKAALAWLAGFYDAEGDKSGKRIRLWSKEREKLALAKALLERLGMEVYGPHLDDKRRGVYVIEVSSSSRKVFLDRVKPEHPKLRLHR